MEIRLGFNEVLTLIEFFGAEIESIDAFAANGSRVSVGDLLQVQKGPRASSESNKEK